MNPFISLLQKYGPIQDSVADKISNYFQQHYKSKNDYFLKAGQLHTNLFMLEKGLVRAFFIKENKEVNTWFGSEGMILGSILPAYSLLPSFENIQFLEDSIVHFITIQDLNKLYLEYPELNLIGRKIAEEYCKIMEERIVSLQSKTAEERYLSLLQHEPDLLFRVSLGHIASYLGVAQETLSRIRKKI
ncbi:Crp/Fnr family transcriptional regulator [Gynurincola endophyticus]|uniref:Crp/Fnr family transcriptional regulator n=1 Tax=Gynurincola endophyticus TaxID=2479004 RepID=UPI000F8D7196|nr:Crp/Fnr family transcriptional regulator [Gynurincola endophyticus]